MFDWLKMLLPGQTVLKDGVLCRQRKLQTKCGICGCLYLTPIKDVRKDRSIYRNGPQVYYGTTCPQCGAYNKQDPEKTAIEVTKLLKEEAANEDNA